MVILVIGIVGYGGWYVWNRNQDNNKQEATDSSQESPSSDTTQRQLLPENFVSYQSDEIGISFGYPQEWGQVTLSKGPETEHLIKGSEYLLTFSGNADISAGLKSVDREHNPDLGHGGGAGPLYVYYSEDDDPFNRTTHLSTETTVLYSESYGSYECEGAATILIQKITGNTTYDEIVFFNINKENTATDQSNIDSVCDENDKYIKQDVVSNFEKLRTTITSTE